ncbi:MAG: DUF58 domain-containing protein [bacterium]|nr:DUF58 domain-containing protein [bacterium]
MSFLPLPISPAHLERFRLRTRAQKQATLVGGHQMRRKGQSLEFHDYRPYLPGDDVRHVDWRASARHGGKDDLLIKTFVAEEHMTLVISIDTRDSMYLPQWMSKVQVAAWLTEAIGKIALRSGDRVVIHRLFGQQDSGVESLQGPASISRIRRVLDRFEAPIAADEPVNVGILDRFLPPTAVWLVLTDFYFHMEADAGKLARRIAQAQDGWRWILTMDLDSWHWEKKYLGLGARKIEGPDGMPVDRQFEIDFPAVKVIEKKITAHKARFRDLVARESYDHIHWEWPLEQENPGEFFRRRFGNERRIQRLFMKGKG